jgi:hypothetical protein
MSGGTEARRRGKDRGQVAIEYLGFLPILLLLAVAGVQLGLAAYTAQQAGTGGGGGGGVDCPRDTRSRPSPGGRQCPLDSAAGGQSGHE